MNFLPNAGVWVLWATRRHGYGRKIGFGPLFVSTAEEPAIFSAQECRDFSRRILCSIHLKSLKTNPEHEFVQTQSFPPFLGLFPVIKLAVDEVVYL